MSARPPLTVRGLRRLAGASFGAAALVIVASLVPSQASAGSVAGAAGTDTSLPPTSSAVTVSGRGAFADYRFTISQTADLTNQAISVTWSGARPAPSVAQNFVQIFQCWGDDDGTNPQSPGPPPEKCQFGGQPLTNITAKLPAGVAPLNEFTRVIDQPSWHDPATFVPTGGVYDPDTGKVWKPFWAVDGTHVDVQTKLAHSGIVSVTWQNPFFSFNTTNEIDFGRTYLTGTGSELFQLHTGLEAPGLGCGQAVEPRPDGTTAIPKCWLVIVPRGTAVEENPPGIDNNNVVTSPLGAAAWANRIAVPLTFNPVDSPCTIGSDERRIVGNELATAAVTSWQPALCGRPGSPPYAYAAISDDQARSQLASTLGPKPGMALVTHPVADPKATDPVVYAPVALSGLVIGFNVERWAHDVNGTVADPAELPLAGQRVANLNLTPRLVAKLLTQSYPSQFPIISQTSPPAGYGWIKSNPAHLFVDPDFVRFNPEFQSVFIGSSRTAGDLVVEASTSDAANELWRWILADPEAKAWLSGTPDESGMVVNPYYATVASANASGAAFAAQVPDGFPKNDPYCFQDPTTVGVPPRLVPPTCLLNTNPYTLSFSSGAQAVRAANDGAKLELDPFAPFPALAYGPVGPQPQGQRSMLTVTDAASAVRYGLQTARLSRAGDDAAKRSFAAPDQAGLLGGLAAMKAGAGGVLLPDPGASSTAATAYPLTMLTYAAVTPLSLDGQARSDYASFLDFAVADGQTPGVKFGQLPPGYAPLPNDLRAQARTAAETIRTLAPPPPPPPSSTIEPAVGGVSGDDQSPAIDTSPAPVATSRPRLSPTTSPPPTSATSVPAAATGDAGSPRTPKDTTGAVKLLIPGLVGLGMISSLGALYLGEPRKKLVPAAVSRSDR